MFHGLCNYLQISYFPFFSYLFYLLRPNPLFPRSNFVLHWKVMADKLDILIAEDDAVLREVYTKKFTLSGYAIRTAEDGEQCIAEIEKQAPQLLILDINMPIMSGFEVLQRFPKDQRTFPIILLTNFGDEKNRTRGEELGCDDFFIKSEMTIKKLLQMVETLVKAKKYWNK